MLFKNSFFDWKQPTSHGLAEACTEAGASVPQMSTRTNTWNSGAGVFIKLKEVFTGDLILMAQPVTG